MVLCDVYDLWSFVVTHVKLWKSLKEHDVFIADLKRFGSDDNNTSSGVSPLKHVGPITTFDKLYNTHKSHNTLPELVSKFVSTMINQWENSLCNLDISQRKKIQGVYHSLRGLIDNNYKPLFGFMQLRLNCHEFSTMKMYWLWLKISAAPVWDIRAHVFLSFLWVENSVTLNCGKGKE